MIEVQVNGSDFQASDLVRQSRWFHAVDLK